LQLKYEKILASNKAVLATLVSFYIWMNFEPFKYTSELDHPEIIPAKFGSNLPSSYSFEENIFFWLKYA
jgi:hypothetical protein